MILLKEFSDGTQLTQDTGFIDNWRINIGGKAPYDVDYFQELVVLSNQYTSKKVYNDFVSIFNNTDSSIDQNLLNNIIPNIAGTYTNDTLSAEKLFSVLHAVMVAEENRMIGTTPTKLGKQIKGLAVAQIFKENMQINNASNFSRKKNWKFLNEEAQRLGVNRHNMDTY